MIDVIVVYKIDRLTRSLADFARMVDLLDEHDVSFVSVTQQFNTKTSMGRLTLNVLLSFAQFEREVTGERIRDKIAASKKRGIWMGGNIPMGYDLGDRELIINESSSASVRHIFQRYVDLGSVQLLQYELERDDIKSPVRIAQSTGRQSGGRPIARGALYQMLSNRIYLGEIVHKGASYPGNHDAIIDPELWDNVQSRLQMNRINRHNGSGAKQLSLLAGLLYDGVGNRFTPSHAVKNSKRYRYYISTGRNRAIRIPAGDIEMIVLSRLQALVGNGKDVLDAVAPLTENASRQKLLLDGVKKLNERWQGLQPNELRSIVAGTIAQICIFDEQVDIHVDPHGLRNILSETKGVHSNLTKAKDSNDLVTLNVKAKLKRCGMEMKLVVSDGAAITQTGPDRFLVTAIVKAHSWRGKLVSGKVKSIRELAAQENSGERYVSRIIRLVHLAPDIIEAILEGRQPAELSTRVLVGASDFPLEWNEQRRKFGFPNPA